MADSLEMCCSWSPGRYKSGGSGNRSLKFKRLEHNPTPTLDEMLSITQRYSAVELGLRVTKHKQAAVSLATSTQQPAENKRL